MTGSSGQEEIIIIPDRYEGAPVTAIGDSAFAYSRHNATITSVTIPDSVVSIGRNAFYNQSGLTSVRIGENSALAAIGRNAFSGNGALRSIYIPAGVTEIGDSAFNNCGSLDRITVSEENAVYSGEGDNLIEIATNTLIRGTSNSVIPASVTAIGPAAFRRTNGKTTLTVPVTVTEIGNYFIANSSITVIMYEDTQEEWDTVAKTSMWNYGNRDVTVNTR